MKELMKLKTILPLMALPVFGLAQPAVKLITLDPGHFHAALIQKSMYPQVDPTVHVYAEESRDLKLHMERIAGYNSRSAEPTSWNEQVYTGKDFFQRMIAEKKGNVVVLAGNNRLKTDYIAQSVGQGFHVFADKPMAIDTKGFEQLKKAFATASKKKVLLYDIMTERFEITTQLQRAFSMEPELFGTLEKGTPEDPSVTKISVHHFYKYVSGSVLTRPSWFFDDKQQGAGIVDVTTHLVDLIQWECFPGQIIDYKKNIQLLNAKSWTTPVSAADFTTVTKEAVPDYLKAISDAKGDIQVNCNGEFTYSINGVHAKVSVIWNYKAPEGTGDTHYSLMRGTNASLMIRQGKAENFKPTLFIEARNQDAGFEQKLQTALSNVSKDFPGISLVKQANGWMIAVPEKYNDGHESHFTQVTKKYLEYLQNNNMPAWEVPNMIAKYYTTTKAKELANAKK
jgi:predicted dehydrogenase